LTLRSLTNSFSGIAPGDVPLFVVAQLLGAAAAALAARVLFDPARTENWLTVAKPPRPVGARSGP
jgi:glycerol uptake facilitator-like aquaporin